MSTNFICSACLDTLTGQHLKIDSNPVCHPCFRQLFTLALESESSFPASWTNHPLSAARYAHILGHHLVQAYQAKAVEYACPPHERVFCSRTDPPRQPDKCEKFVGRWQEAKRCVRCDTCMWYTCLRCEESFSTGDVAGVEVEIEHECDPKTDQELEGRAFKGLRRGEHFQICPNHSCKRRVELSHGCNHIRCICRTHFCFICGDFVKDGYGHWRKEGGCPRFGQKDSERAIYDEDDAWDDNGDIDDDQRAIDFQRMEDGGAEALRRAFEVQMRLVEDMRRELEAAEARRLKNRERESEGVSGPSETLKHRRRRRGRPEEDGNANVQRSEERRRARRDARNPPPSPEVRHDEDRPRRRRGLRGLWRDAKGLFEENLAVRRR